MPESILVRIELAEIIPSIWRSFVVPTEITFHQFHQAIQAVMGWSNSHLYEFKLGDDRCALPNPDAPDKPFHFTNSKKEILNHWLLDGITHIEYMYDFGDGWEHIISFGELSQAAPCCLDGAWACPPEDCGGAQGYVDLVRALRDPKHPEHKQLKKWAKDWSPEKFDREAATRRLQTISFGRRNKS